MKLITRLGESLSNEQSLQGQLLLGNVLSVSVGPETAKFHAAALWGEKWGSFSLDVTREEIVTLLHLVL